MDCFQILLLLLLAGSCGRTDNARCIARQGINHEPDDCGCHELDVPGPEISRTEQEQAAPYPFLPYPV